MRSGMHKPPVPPKPSLAARSALSPSTPRREGLSLPSPGTPRRVKPQLAPKPCLSKIATSLESKPFTPKSQVHATQRTEVSNSQKEIQQENKKPNWDYIIPICLCSDKNCTCVRNTSANLDKHEKDSKSGKAGARVAVANGGEKILTNDHVTNHKPLQETFTADRNLNTDTSQVSVRPCVPHRTWSDEANGNVILQSEPAGGTEEDALGSVQTPCAPKADSKRKPVPVPVPRKPRTSVLTRQEKVEEEREEIMRREGRDTNVNKVKVSLERKGNSSPAESQTVSRSATMPCGAQAPPPRKRPFLFTPEKAATSAPRSLPKDVEEDDLGWDSSSHEMEVSVDEEGEMLEQEKGEARHQETVYADFRSSPPVSRLLETPELSQPPAVTTSAGDVQIKVAPKKLQREKSPMAWRQRNEPSEEKREEKVADERGQTPALKERVMKELPLPPAERPGRNLTAAGAIKPSRRSLGKQRAKSFSSADLVRSEGQSRKSFRKLLDLKLSVKMLPKLVAKGGPSPDGAANENVNVVERKTSLPLIRVEQSVDGDDYGEDADIYYENIPYYEEIADYINVDVGTAVTSAQSPLMPPAAWQSVMYNDEGIYEEQEPYMSFEKPAEQRQCRTPTDCERDSVDEEVAYPGNGPSDDGVLANSSDEEEDDSSSISSKGDCEQPEESPKQSGQKNKSKIQHIATEIMTSESVFVDVLKLLHVDFRGTVEKASSQNGKPVIEERLLNQILYYLPQLYELNQNLLRELKQRVAKWDENAQLADIFLKKGPYLKMYSTYIREFDKNVALLDEQSKRNSAFGAVVREFEASPLCANLALKHYLLKPVQRIPQYQLLLTDYLKNLSEDSADYKDTQAALAIVKEVANHANDIMKQGDNFQKLIQVQCRLIGNHEIVQPGRFFLKEGILKKMSRKVMQPRMFFLFSDSLLYTTPVQSGQYKVKNMFSLAGMKVSKPSQEAYQNDLNVESVERSFTLSASSASERDEWLEAISTAINDYTRKKITFISGKSLEEKEVQGYDDSAPLGSKAPIWIPDPRTTMCMICTFEFTMTWRRHHCRACGKVVCKPCSSHKYRLEYLKNELARVCDQCFLILQQQKYKTAPLSTASPGKGATFAFRKHKKIPAALKEVSANTDSSMSGYLQMSKSTKKQGKRLWFVIKDKVLYTYAASEDVAALKSQPLLGFELKVDSPQSLEFKLYHKKTLYFIFRADDVQTAQRWIHSFREAFNIS